MNYTVTTVSAALTAVLALSWIVRRRSNRDIRTIVGPPSPSWIFGNMLQQLLSPSYGDYEFKWRKAYGSVYRIKGCLGQDRLMVSDPTAVQYLVNCPSFHYPRSLEALLRSVYGAKSIIARRLGGDHHKQLRAWMNPAFAAAAVRQYQPVFARVAQRITERIDDCETLSIDMCPLLSDASLSSISEVVFGCPVEDLSADLVESTFQIVHLSSNQSASQILFDAISNLLPGWILRHAVYLPIKHFRVVRTQLHLANREGWRLVREKTEAAKQGLETGGDLYSVLLNSDKSNSGRLREEDVVAQTSLLMVAGHDTAAKTLAFGLIELAQNAQFQESLRAEIHAALGTGRDSEHIPYDSMPLLNAFIKETLRMYPALPISDRRALKDEVIPLSESIVTTAGKQLDRVHIRKGEVVSIAIASYQRLMESRWGDDADKFRPARWLDGTVYQGEAIGPYANLFSFLGGPRTCLGWRFAIFEMQVFLCELVGKFSFSLPKDYYPRVKIANLLLPTDSHGNKGALLEVKRVL
ncbi:cytochrome P450 [Mycena pura]|uniref:Cytochrome P450 n=1 Tax=Mycena pura TaxID=153505 RepID=A0AAD6Y1Y7_9AGAR|nr:cytochrome P450 [Mycena pura]